MTNREQPSDAAPPPPVASGAPGAGTLIVVEKVSKSYGGVKALSQVSMEIGVGEIHALCGENGAGKSTLIKVLAGSVMPETGRVLAGGEALTLGSVRASEGSVP